MIDNKSKTRMNLMKALEGESVARNRYSFFAEKASKEGLEETAKMFERLAENEMRHALLWFQLLNDGVNETESNLQEASRFEDYESNIMYVNFAKEAQEEGYGDVALLMDKVSKVEAAHKKMLLRTIDELNGKSVTVQAGWVCKVCGYVADTVDAPMTCPLCGLDNQFEARH